ncbi:hypothetical protein [Pedobacter frigiditerrae]|uniref:hypothetical protein n=1 Tax=Pedobacter frigiditerrae TaxID=2530452 RepID=UPI00292FCE44|nr:hypothetical protein [Pedobacter frigiditerrae]
MRIKTFWIIVIKIIGLVFLLNSLSVISNSIFTSYLTVRQAGGETSTVFILILPTALVFLFLIFLFLFKAHWLVRILKLEKDFNEDRIELNMTYTKVINIAIIVISGVILANSIPQLCYQIFNLIRDKIPFGENQDFGFLIIDTVKIIVATGFMLNSKTITALISKSTHH